MKTNSTLRVCILTGLFAVPFIAFIISGSMLFPFITGKNFGFRILIELVFVLWAILAMRDERYMPKRSWLLYTYSIFFVAMAVADIFGVHPYKSIWSNYERMEGLVAHIHFFLYFIVLSSAFQAQKTWDWFLATWIGAGTVMSLYGLLQVAGKLTINQGGVRVDGTFGNATYLAVFLLFTICFTVFLWIRKGLKSAWMWFLAPTLLLQLAVLYFTATRGAILGLLGGALVTTAIIAFWDKDGAKIRKSALGVLIVLVVLVGGFFLVRNTSFVTKSPVLSRFASLSLSDIQTQGRYYIWPMAVTGFTERPLAGWGQENFNFIFNAHYNPAMYAQEQWFDRAHNMFLDWLVAGGLITFIPYLALFFFFFWYLWRKSTLDLSFVEKSILSGLMLAYIFQGLFVFDNLVSYILFFSLLAYVHAHSDGTRFTLPAWMKQSSVATALSAILVIVLGFSLYFVNIKPIEASQNLINALNSSRQAVNDATLDSFEKVFQANTFGSEEALEQLAGIAGSFGNATPALQNRYVTMTEQEFDKQVAENPNDARIRVMYGIFLRNTGQNDQSLVQLNKAVALSPKKQTILFELGATDIALKKYPEAEAVFKTAYDLAPSYQEAQIIYAVGAIYAGDSTTVNTLIAGIDPQVVVFDDRIVAALAATGRYQDLIKVFTTRLGTDEGKSNIQNYFSLAVAYVGAGEVNQAVTMLRQVEAANPTYKDQIEQYIAQVTAK